MILYEDDALIVAHKPAGIATQTAKIGQTDMISLLRGYRKQQGEDTYIGVIHRLDQPVEGLLVFAKTAQMAGKLSRMLQKGEIKKQYAALTAGIPETDEGLLRDFLLQDRRTNLSRVVPEGTAGAKEARLQWRLVKRFPGEGFSLMEIEIFTGRHHQIRVQMSNAGMPLLGDAKYGSDASREISEHMDIKNTALLADKLLLTHPVSRKPMAFSIEYPRQWYHEGT
ncbi:MAG: RluA family pseudouridine synthase [Roseburia sp.]|nr:RluA family pseudouridine synthase [Roseburia sp.]